MEDTIRRQEARPHPRRNRRLAVILLLGIAAILAGLAIRSSTWARERQLSALSVDELALAIHDSPNDALTFVYYGSALMKAGNLPDSERAFDRAAHLDPKMERAHLGLGSVRLRTGKLEGAKKDFQEAVRLNPKDTEAYLGLAQANYRLGWATEAISALQKITEIAPRTGPAWYFLGKIYGEAHQSDKAMEALQHAVQIEPNRAEYWRDLGQTSQFYAKLDDAEKQYRKALHLSPNDPLTHFWLGQVYARMADTPKIRGQAEQEFLAAISRDPTMSEAYYDLGLLYERHGNYSMAAANYKKARDLDESDEQSLYHLGLCLIKLGDTVEGSRLVKGSQDLHAAKKAVEYMQKRILAEPRRRDYRLRMARLYRQYGNVRDALGQYDVYQKLGPADPAVAREVVSYEKELAKQGVRPEDALPVSAAQPQSP